MALDTLYTVRGRSSQYHMSTGLLAGVRGKPKLNEGWIPTLRRQNPRQLTLYKVFFSKEKPDCLFSLSRIQLTGGGCHGVLHPHQCRSVQARTQGVVPGWDNRRPHRSYHPRLWSQVSLRWRLLEGWFTNGLVVIWIADNNMYSLLVVNVNVWRLNVESRKVKC